MHCPFCNFEDTKVIDSRPIEGKKRRRRECTNCGRRFTTYEIIDKPLITVRKKDGSFELFDKEKLLRGIYSAVSKRPVNIEAITGIADDIEALCTGELRYQISSVEIGNMVLEKLKNLDEVAYIRFASVYKDFTDAKSFVDTISELIDSKN